MSGGVSFCGFLSVPVGCFRGVFFSYWHYVFFLGVVTTSTEDYSVSLSRTPSLVSHRAFVSHPASPPVLVGNSVAVTP